MLLIILIMLVVQVIAFGIGSAVFMAAAGGMDWSRIQAAIEESPIAALTALFNANWPWVTLAGLAVSVLYGVLVILGIAARTHQQTAIGLHHFKNRAQIVQVVLVALRALEQGVTAE
jgi:hypothetical protein